LEKLLTDGSDAISSQAAYYLSLLRDTRLDYELEVRAAKRRIQPVLERHQKHSVRRAWVVGPIPIGLADNDDLREDRPIDLTAPQGKLRKHWTEMELAKVRMELDENFAWAYVYFRVHSNRRQALVFPELGPGIWHNGKQLSSLRDVKMNAELQPGSNEILIAFSKVPESIDFWVEEPVTVSLPDRLDGAELAKRLRESVGPEKVTPEFLNVDWSVEMKKGDVANGRRLFGTLACAKCHAIAAEQKGGGAPSLLDASKRFTIPHVVESMLLPSRQVAEPFRASRITLKSGQDLSGLVASETNESIEVLLPDGTRKTIAKNDIEERTITQTSPMPAGLVKTVAELRDLLAYLFSDKPQPP
jgi:putative heme-binding domain-containing protein